MRNNVAGMLPLGSTLRTKKKLDWFLITHNFFKIMEWNEGSSVQRFLESYITILLSCAWYRLYKHVFGTHEVVYKWYNMYACSVGFILILVFGTAGIFPWQRFHHEIGTRCSLNNKILLLYEPSPNLVPIGTCKFRFSVLGSNHYTVKAPQIVLDKSS